MRKYGLILFIIIAGLSANAQNKEVNEDSCLRKLEAILPAGWQLKISTNWLLVQSQDSAWVAKNNGQLKPGDVKKQGNIKPLSFMFRSEPRWSDERINAGKVKNASVWKEIDALKAKYHLENVDMAKQEGENVAAYRNEVAALKGKLVELPVFNTEKWSLFDTFFNEKISNEIYYPTSAGDEMLKVHSAIRLSLIPVGSN